MLCMIVNKTNTALQGELNIVLQKYSQSGIDVCSEIKICEIQMVMCISILTEAQHSILEVERKPLCSAQSVLFEMQ